MNTLYELKYFKYKNKYLKLKKKLNNNLTTKIFKGGGLLNYSSVDIHNISDNFFVLNYHGELTKSIFKTPNNIILILSNCCGAYNYASRFGWYDPFQNIDQLNKNTLTKGNLFEQINIGKGKIKISEQEYFVLNPNSDICDLNLKTIVNDFAVGEHIKKFDYSPFYDTELQLNIEESFNKNFDKIKDYIENKLDKTKFKEQILLEIKYYKPDFNVYLKESIDIQILLYMFDIKYKQTLLDNSNLIDIIDFFNTSYGEFLCVKKKILSSYKINFDLFVENKIHYASISTQADLKNCDILLFLFFNTLIKKNPEQIKLSDKLYNLGINSPPDKLTFVILYACQSAAYGHAESCIIDDCYKRFYDIENDDVYITNFLKKIKDAKNSNVTNITDNVPQIYFDDGVGIKTLLPILIKKISENSHYSSIININENDLIIFINLLYDIINNTGEPIYTEYEIIYSVGKLIFFEGRNKGNTIYPATIRTFYGKDSMILSYLINNHSYFNSFMDELVNFIKILKKYIKEPITVENFYDSFSNSKITLYNELLFVYKNYKKIIFPNDINNQNQIKKLFENISFKTEQEKKDFCNDSTSILATKLDILKKFKIYIISSYTPNHTILSLNELSLLVNARVYNNLKIEYITHLIRQYGCEKQVAEYKIEPKPESVDAWD
jgi:hypothetical protein